METVRTCETSTNFNVTSRRYILEYSKRQPYEVINILAISRLTQTICLQMPDLAIFISASYMDIV
jgi:hypothetical protein